MRAEDDWGAVRSVILGGEAVAIGEFAQILVSAHDRPRIFNLYGITEVTVHATVKELTAADVAAGLRSPIGTALRDLTFAVLDGDRCVVPVGEVGELWIGGAGVARGYVNRAELTAERFVPGLVPGFGEMRWYGTGDLVRQLPSGEFDYLGRIDRQVKLRGFRIELGEIEAVLAGHPAVSAVAVELAAGDGQDAGWLAGYLVVADPAGLTADEVRGWLATRLPDYMVPSEFVAVTELPLTPNGKVDRDALPGAGGVPLGRHGQLPRPRTAVEERLQSIWASVLQVAAIGTDDNFFTIGGNSMLALKVVSACKAAGLAVTVRDLFVNPTLSGFAAAAGGATARGAATKADHATDRGADHGQRRDTGAVDTGIEAVFPAVHMQCGMLFESERQPARNIYHVVSSASISGLKVVSRSAVMKAVRQVTKDSTALRTSFDFVNFSSPMQVVHTSIETQFRYEDLSGVGEREQRQCIDEIMTEERRTRFRRTDYPLWRGVFLCTGADSGRVILTHHHAILDGWSVTLFFDQLKNALNSVSYPTASRAVNERMPILESQAMQSAESRGFWRAEAAAWRQLPMNALSRPGEQPHLVTGTAVIDADLREAVRNAARAWGCAPKHLYLAAHLRAVARFAGWNDYAATGLVVNARPEEANAEAALGVFLNTVPFAMQGLGSSWQELTKQVMMAEARLQPHRWFPLTAMITHFGIAPLNVWFNYTDFSVTSMRDYLHRVTETNITEMPLTVSVVDDGLIVEASSEYTSADMCKQHLDMHIGNVREAIEEHEKGIPQSDSRRRGSPAGQGSVCSGDRREPPACLVPDAIARRAAVSPGAVAVVGAGECWTYGELVERADRVAWSLLGCGVQPGDLVGVCLERGPWLVAVLLGVLRAGCAYVPLDPEYPVARLEFMVADAGVSAVVTGPGAAAGAAVAEAAGVRVLRVGDVVAGGGGGDGVLPRVGARDLAYVIYTSGSTGTPKGVAVEHRGMANVIDAVASILDTKSDDVVAALTTPAFDVAVVELLMPLSVGASIAVADSVQRHPGQVGGFLNSCGATIALATPTTWAVVAASGWIPERRLAILSGGERLPDATAASLLNRGVKLYNGYGPTEASIYASVGRLEPGKSVTIGGPLQNLTFAVLDGDRCVVPVGEVGELWIGGAGVARGYVNRAELTAERFVPGLVPGFGEMRWYGTGDLVRQLPSGEFDYLGRIDRQVKLRGFRIELGEIEAVLAGHPAVSAVAVELAAGDGQDAGWLAGYLVVADPAGLTADEVRGWLATRLPDYMVPSEFVAVTELPLTPNGKVDRDALPGAGGVPLGRHGQLPRPRTAVEERLQSIWASVLQVAAIGTDDNFFTIGGNSIYALRVAALVGAAFGIDMSVVTLLRHPTLSDLADWVDRANAPGHGC